jgi:uncharacterized membrane-anchored protein YhcB (DUF1043 family)
MTIFITWLFTIITLVIGGVIGYLIGSKKLNRKIEQIQAKIKKPLESGPIKPYNKEERKALGDTAESRIKELI